MSMSHDHSERLMVLDMNPPTSFKIDISPLDNLYYGSFADQVPKKPELFAPNTEYKTQNAEDILSFYLGNERDDDFFVLRPQENEVDPVCAIDWSTLLEAAADEASFMKHDDTALMAAAEAGDLTDILGDLLNNNFDDFDLGAPPEEMAAALAYEEKTEAEVLQEEEAAALEEEEGEPAPPPPPPVMPTEYLSTEKVIYPVICVDGTNKKIAVPSHATARELLNQFCAKIRLKAVDYFGLYEQNDDGTGRWLEPDVKLSAQRVATWTQMSTEKVTSKIVMRVRYFKRLREDMADPIADSLFYHQIKDEIVTGKYFVAESVAVRLASYQIQESFGDHQPLRHKPGFLDDMGIEAYIPPVHVKSNSSPYWQKRLFQLHKKYRGLSGSECMKMYWDLARGLPSFGARLYQVYTVGPPPHFKETQAICGVAEDGLIVQTGSHQDKGDEWEFFHFRDLRGWSTRQGDATILEIHKPNPQMAMLMDVLTFRADESTVAEIIHSLNEYRYLIGPSLSRADAAHVNPDPTGQLARSLPPPLVFEEPVTRSLMHPQRSRLENFKRCYIKGCLTNGAKPVTKVYLRVDNCLDNGTDMELLDLTNCQMDLPTFQVVARAVNNTFTGEGTSSLAHDDEFKENFIIKTLNISGNPIFTVGSSSKAFASLGQILETATVTRLDLGKTKLSSVLEDFADCLAMTVEDSKLGRVSNARNLKELVLSGNQLKAPQIAKVMHSFKETKHLELLDLRDNLLEDGVMEALAGFLSNPNSALNHLDLSMNKMSDKGMMVMAQCLKENHNSNLRTLCLQNNKISTKGALVLCDALFNMKKLEVLKLSRNELSAKFGVEVANMLEKTNFLKNLALNKVSLEKKGCRALAKALSKNSSLTSINLSNNGFDDDASKTIASSLGTDNRTLTSLTLMNNQFGGKAALNIFRVLNTNDVLTTLDVSFCKVSTDALKKLAETLTTRHSLQILGLIGNEFGKSGMKHVCTCIKESLSLKKIFIDSNKIPDKSAEDLVEALSNNRVLTVLSMKDNLFTRDALIDIISCLEHNNALKQLDLTGNPGCDYKQQLVEVAKKKCRAQCLI